MNTLYPAPTASDVLSLLDDEPARVPNTSMLSGIDTVPTAAACHQNDVHKPGEAHTMTDRMCAMGDGWVASTRGHVRGRPLASLAVAMVLGALIARMTKTAKTR
ncbi:hypothetical protein [Hydrogenophaga sp. OTU3427]|uniref:hypothetical protein n=1 Tax=Hydrogenophaga sp. OTU3427 TaxID=3043856 RepID=UPI00313C0950